MNIYVALVVHAIFAILWLLDSSTIQRRRRLKKYYAAEERNNELLSKAAMALVSELDAWMNKKEKNLNKDEELQELMNKVTWDEVRSRWNHPTNQKRDYEIDISHILKDKMSKPAKEDRKHWYYFTPVDFTDRNELGGPSSGMWKKPKSDE